MGGSGSGNWYRWNTKPTEENFWRFSISRLKQCGVIGTRMRASGNWQWSRGGEVCSWISYEVNTLEESAWLRVHYNNKSTGKAYDYRISLITTRPNYGGERWWFCCPVQGCGRRVAVLYLAHVLACRWCCGFTYNSQNEAPPFRLLHKAQALHEELGGDGFVDIPPRKPKGMHWKTYWRKVEQMESLHDTAMEEAMRRFGIEL